MSCAAGKTRSCPGIANQRPRRFGGPTYPIARASNPYVIPNTRIRLRVYGGPLIVKGHCARLANENCKKFMAEYQPLELVYGSFG